MEGSSKKSRFNKNPNDLKTYPVPFSLEEVNENNLFHPYDLTKSSKNQIINQAINFHAQGNIQEAIKYYQYCVDLGCSDPRVFSNYGTIVQDLGKLKKAELLQRKAIELKPDFTNAHLNLGNILRDLGKLEEAAIYTRKAIELKPDFAEAHSNLGNIFQELGNAKEAVILQRKAIELNPCLANAYYNLGISLKDLGKLNEAELCTRKAIDLRPNFESAHSNLGNILQDLGRLKEAELSQRKAVELNPNLVMAHCNLGQTLKDLGNSKEAEQHTQRAIELKPDLAEAHSNLGTIYQDLGKLKEAELATRKAIKLKPNYATAHLNLGSILIDIGNLKGAEISTRKAIELDPGLAVAYYNLGSILVEVGNLKEAEFYTRKAIKLKPNFPQALYNLGVILKELNKFNEAIIYFKKAISLDKKLSIAKSGLIEAKGVICDWSDQEVQANWIKNLGIEGSSINPLSLFYYEDNPLNQLKRSRKFYQDKFTRKTSKLVYHKKKKIHIGYFSADFMEHATMYLIGSILELHDKSEFEIYLYSFTPYEDKYTTRAKNSGCFFRDIKQLTTKETVELARKDKLDIAIDLKGYTQHCRTSIFSYRVAPIQINYLGYPGSLGANTIDYIIADNILIPKEYERFYSEKIIRMPNSYQCNDNKKEIAKVPVYRKIYNLPEQGFIFTCFNANKKITPKEFDIWMNLLKEIKGSVLWLYKSNQYSVKNLITEAENRNIDSERLIFANKLQLKEHLLRHSLGDLGLDTFNYNGHTTTSDALWSGLPVLTKIGESFAARVSASLLTSMGLTELITYNEKEYEDTALNIARDPKKLLKLKSKLHQSRGTSSLYNSELFTKTLERKFKELIKTNH